MDPRQPNPDLYGVPFQTDEYQGMPYRPLGGSGLKASAIGLGTWKFGYPDTGDGARSDEETSLAILDRAAEVGMTFWDTANRYNAASGNSERIIGTWFERNPGRRRDIVLATKIFGGMDGTTPNHSGLSRLQIIEGVKACLARLGIESIDLLWFHGFDDAVPIEESLETIEDLVSQDLVRYLGVSNFTAANLESYLRVSSTLSRRTRPVAVQNRYDPLTGADHDGVLELCAAERISFVPYSPLARGLLTDRYLDPAKVGKGDRLFDEGVKVTADQRATVTKVAELAKGWGHSVSQLTLAYLLTMPGMGIQIPSSSTPEQVDANAEAGKIELSDEQVAELKDVFGH
ncbi:aldo/keto reductase [Propionibacteriaceae bacterium Y2011]|uniref:aldo/keto reductase n=1 Tax=Microlunatus sp. Y2014 TaxID=3418488 RepID=UPI003B47BB30